MTWEGMGSRDRRDGVGRFGRGGHTPLGHWRNLSAQLQVVCRRTAKITSEQGLKALKNVRNFQPSSRQERWPSGCECVCVHNHSGSVSDCCYRYFLKYFFLWKESILQ